MKSGLLKIEAGQADKGAADLNKALKIPEIGVFKPVAQLGLLRVLYETNKYKQLLDSYEAALKDLPAESKPEVLLLAANSNRQLNDAEGRERTLRAGDPATFPTRLTQRRRSISGW